MKIDDDLLTKLENLSSLKIEKTKRELVENQLSEVLNFMQNLNELKLEDQSDSFNMLQGGTLLRKDEPSDKDESIDIIIENSPNHEERFFCVPPIIE